jgi:hypothetical protein
MTDLETGTCSYEIWYHVHFSTSGTELTARQEYIEKFPTELDANLFIANHRYNFTKRTFPGFTRRSTWQGNNGYTTSRVSRVIEYGDLIPMLESKCT